MKNPDDFLFIYWYKYNVSLQPINKLYIYS